MDSAEPSVRGRGADAVDRLHEQLQVSLRALVSSEDWRHALEVAARFHDYSFANTQLIWAQAKAHGFTPTRVAGYRAWQKLGRQVNRGEKGLQILAPVTRSVETEDGEDERRVVGFRVVHVFDQSQTDGEPIPEVRPAVLEGELPAHWEKVAELIRSADFGLDVAEVARLGEANGITDWLDRTVIVRESLSGAQRFKTAVHELAETRTVIVPRFVVDRLKPLLDGQNPGDLVLTAPQGGVWREPNFRRRVFGPAAVAAGPPNDLVPHDLRDTAASLLIASGASIKAVQRALGHASAKVTLDVYGSLHEEDLEALADRMEERFSEDDVAPTLPEVG